MSRENVALVQRAFEAVLREDWPALFETLHPEVEVYDFDIPDAGIYHGRDGFLSWLARWSEGWESWRVEDLEFRAVGQDKVIALFRMITKGSASGLEIERGDAIVYRVKDNLIARSEYFNDHAEALEAAGLPK